MPDKKQAANKKSKRTYIIIWEYVKTYLQNSGIHGVKYLVEDGRHWSERCTSHKLLLISAHK